MERRASGRAVPISIVVVMAMVLGTAGLAGPAGAAPSDLGPFSSAEVLVRRQYDDFLGRIPFAGELTAQAGRLAAGTADAPTVISDIADTSGGADRTGSITRLYLAYFLRNPDAGGLAYWVGKARNGTTLQRISSSFAGSSEFRTRYGSLTNAAFVRLVYQNVLGRPGDPGGISYWTSQLDRRRKDRGQVMLGFSESSEYRRKTADRVDVVVVHAAMVKRIPTGQAWTDALALVAADGRLALIRRVFDSDAYRGRFPLPPAPTDLAVDAEDASLLVRWSAPTGAVPAIEGFEVRATPASGPVAIVEVSASARSTVVPGLVNGTAYTVTVRAENGNGLGPAGSIGPVTPAVPSRWTTYQGTPVHDGRQASEPPPSTPTKKWAVDFTDAVSYPLVARGRAFVIARASGSGHYGGRLYALDLDTGATLWGPKEVGGVYYKPAFAWDRGLVYVLNGDGLVQAFREADGTVAWTAQIPNEYLGATPPTARDGVVYVVGRATGTVIALDGATGAIRWEQGAPDGQITPIVTSKAVYLNGSCSATALSLTGKHLWTTPSDCDAWPGAASTLAGDRLLVRSAWGREQGIVSTSGTNLTGTYPSLLVPAIAGSTGIGVTDTVVTAFDPATLASPWSATWTSGTIALAPVIAGGRAYVAGTSGVVRAYDLATGAVVWSTDAGDSIDSVDEWNYSEPLVGLAVAEGHLLVPVNDELVAYG